ncbi:hypothetical protein K503DRAFT_136501 [Rhizopogon vinicolor AM-OR11-026]|uniref:Uncharacterized protein n=1 Tax=Rhizopogon vinicolor AM-OR11-026 TaxID=1314800 RepID=A0A1B7N1P0_9AGAM|nr:hypothetical protein K503DRAFT_136501 [Rhizopogon vinicolor AM-OR11-026]
MSLIKQDDIDLGNLLAAGINLFDGEVDIKVPNLTSGDDHQIVHNLNSSHFLRLRPFLQLQPIIRNPIETLSYLIARRRFNDSVAWGVDLLYFFFWKVNGMDECHGITSFG